MPLENLLSKVAEDQPANEELVKSAIIAQDQVEEKYKWLNVSAPKTMPKFKDIRASLDDRTSFLDRLKFNAFRRKHTPIDPETLFEKSITDLGAQSQPDEIEPKMKKKQKIVDTDSQEQITSVSHSQSSNSTVDAEVNDNSNGEEAIDLSEHAEHFPLSLKPALQEHQTHGIRRIVQANSISSLELNAESQSYLSMIEDSTSFEG